MSHMNMAKYLFLMMVLKLTSTLETCERFLGVNLHKQHNITGGGVFKEIIEGERRGDYIGQTVQFIPT